MSCTKCGGITGPTSKFCAECGSVLHDAAVRGTAASTMAGFQHHHPHPLESIEERLDRLACTEKLEGFSLAEMFSEVLKKRSSHEIDDYLIAGTYRTTPPIATVQTGWPKPWLFARVLLFVGVIYVWFVLAIQLFQKENVVPLIMMGSLAIPLAIVILFFEFNTPRNVSFHYVLMLVFAGGVVSSFVSLVISGRLLPWFTTLTENHSALRPMLGPMIAGIIEEIGKLVAVVVLVRQSRYKYILNGLLFGAAVGAGFAAYESAGYALRVLQREEDIDAMLSIIQARALLSPFGHVAWTAIAAAALWRVKRERAFELSMLLDTSFLKTLSIPIVLHMIWNSPIPSPFLIVQLVVGVIGWFIVFSLLQQGLRQVRDEQLQVAQTEMQKTKMPVAASGDVRTLQGTTLSP